MAAVHDYYTEIKEMVENGLLVVDTFERQTDENGRISKLILTFEPTEAFYKNTTSAGK